MVKWTKCAEGVPVSHETGTDPNGGEYIEFKPCGVRSYNANDIEQKYCGFCHKFRGNCTVLEPEEAEHIRFLAGKKPDEARWRGRRNAKVTVGEPLAQLVQDLMEQEGVSDLRMRRHLGWGWRRIMGIRREERLWKGMAMARQMLAAMGFELVISVKRFANPHKDLVITKADIRDKRQDKIRATGKKSKFDASRIWEDDDVEGKS